MYWRSVRARIISAFVGVTLLLTLAGLLILPQVVRSSGISALPGGKDVEAALILALVEAILVTATVGAILVVIAASILAQSIVWPIDELTDLAGALADGRFERTALVAGPVEVARLGQALNNTAEALRRTFARIELERDRTAAVLAQMADAVLLADGRGRIILANPAAALILDIDLDRARGRRLEEILRESELIELVQSPSPPETPVTRMIERGSPRRLLRAVYSALEGGEANQRMLVVQDLSEVHRLESVRRDFVANVSHELRTPITAIKVMAETLEDGGLADPVAARDFVHRIQMEVSGLAQLVEELLELSRVESGRVGLNISDLPAAELVSTAVERMQPLAARAGVALLAGTAGDLPSVRADPERVAQVFSNLIHNAIKFTPPAGSVTVTAAQSDGYVCFSVQDTGLGLEAKDQERIFERFYKADRARASEGSGLGLAIVKHLVQAHGGEVSVHSAGKGTGACFTFTLPAVIPAATK